ncbi:MAG: hypothetical protein JXB39_02695 [Deltaproteobacteria bacterium]|nr:hypothetical protein [Deltaproteobacteria bacterium]
MKARDPAIGAAFTAYLRTAAAGADHVGACTAAAEAAWDASGADPWRVLEAAGPLARAGRGIAETDQGLDARLRPVPPGDPRALVQVPSGAPLPVPDPYGRRARGAFDTPPDLAREAVARGLAAARGPVRCAVDPGCGPGAFLAALEEAGVVEVVGEDLDEAALAVARVVAPGARVVRRDGLTPGDPADLAVGNPPFVPPERQERAARRALAARFPWLHGRFDLSVPFAAAAVERVRSGGAAALVLPAPLLVQPYGRALRRIWLTRHRIVHVGASRPFPGASVRVAILALTVDAGPGPVAPWGVPASEVLALADAPILPGLEPGDASILAWIRARSIHLGDLARVDTGTVAHGPGHRRDDLVHDAPKPGRKPWVDAADLVAGCRRWIDWVPDRMHRPKDLDLFAPPKILVGRIAGRGPVRVWLDEEDTIAGHTCIVIRPRDGRVPPARLCDLLADPRVRGILRLERGARLDLYPHDVRDLPVPRAWLEDPTLDLGEAWNLAPSAEARLLGAGSGSGP